MKKIVSFAFCAALAICAVPAFASSQVNEDDQVVSDAALMMANKFTKNWEFTAMLGAQTYQAEYSQFSMDVFQLKDSWRIAGDLSLVKWASPYFGLGFGFTEAGYSGVYGQKDDKTTFAKTGDPLYGGDYYHLATGSYGNLYVKATTNLTNFFLGFKPDRRFEVTAYLGGGIIFPTCKVDYFAKGATFNAGLNAQVRLAKHLFFTASVRGALISDGFNGINYTSSGDSKNLSLDGQAGALGGLSYKFGYSKRKNQKTGFIGDYEWIPATVAYETSEVVKSMIDNEVANVENVKAAEISDISNQLAASNKEIERLCKENARIQKLLDESRAAAFNGSYWQYISFKIDHTNITNNQMVDVQAAADYIKAAPNKKFVINGYADKQTATPEHNVMLANGRAKAVYEALVNKFGVNPDQLEYYGNGGVDYMYYNDAKCSRCVLITTK